MAGTKEKQKDEDYLTYLYQHLPFNFCDRWCERCSLTDRCLIFQQAFNDRLKHIFQGEDPDDPTIIVADIKKTYGRLIENIKKDIRKQGLDLKKVRIKIIRTGFKQGSQLENFSLWRLGRDFSRRVHLLINSILSEEDDELQESPAGFRKEIEELNWYHIFFENKLYQSLAVRQVSKKEKEKTLKRLQKKETDVAAALSCRALKTCQRSLEEISRRCTGYSRWAGDLAIFARFVVEKIETEFPDSCKEKIIFHGKK